MEPPEHPAYLKICHQKIGDTGRKWRWCDLPSVAWCYDCEYAICELHLIARHEFHRTQVEE